MAFPLILPDYTTQTAAAYKTAIDAVIANYKRKAGALSVEAQASPNMTVLLRSGSYFKNSTGTNFEIAQQNISISAAPTLPNNRIDLISLDALTGNIVLTAGTPAASPTAPATPSLNIPLAEVYVDGNATSILMSKITDRRPGFWEGGGGGVTVRNVYTSSTTWNKDVNLIDLDVEVVGGGNNGGAISGTRTKPTCGGGGGGGGYSRKLIQAAALGASETVTVGSVGATSSFGAHCSATGGSAGTGNIDGGLASGGVGGTGSGGNINIQGRRGDLGQSISSNWGIGGNGGSSPLGFGGIGTGSNSALATGGAGTGYGAGGAGTAFGGSGTGATGSNAGGAGTGGVIIVTERRRA